MNEPYRPDLVAEVWERPLLLPPVDLRVVDDYVGRRLSRKEMSFIAVAVGLDSELNVTKQECAAVVLR